MLPALILSNISLRDRCLGGNSTHQHRRWCNIRCQLGFSPDVDTWWRRWSCIKCVNPRKYKAECIIYQLSLSRAAVEDSKGDTRKKLFCPVGVQFFLFVIRTWCIQVQNHSVLAPWKTLCCFFFLFKEIFIYNNTNATPPTPPKKH